MILSPKESNRYFRYFENKVKEGEKNNKLEQYENLKIIEPMCQPYGIC